MSHSFQDVKQLADEVLRCVSTELSAIQAVLIDKEETCDLRDTKEACSARVEVLDKWNSLLSSEGFGQFREQLPEPELNDLTRLSEETSRFSEEANQLWSEVMEKAAWKDRGSFYSSSAKTFEWLDGLRSKR